MTETPPRVRSSMSTRTTKASMVVHLVIASVLMVNKASAFLLPPSYTASNFDWSIHSELAKVAVEYNDFLPHPNPDYNAQDVVQACMSTLLHKRDEGLEVCFNFSSDRCRAALGGSLQKFNEYANNPVFSFLVQCADWNIVSVGPIIQGTPTRGSMQTILMDAIPRSNPQQHEVSKERQQQQQSKDARRFLWTLQQERRPPRQGCWVIHEVMYVKNAFALTL
jgi:hypothetical protein